MKFLSISLSLAQLPNPSQTFRLGEDHFKIIILELLYIEDSQKKKNVMGKINSCFAEMKL